MALSSMTGFARSEGQVDGTGWVWEAKSVNAKGLDVRFRLPSGYDGLEAKARSKVQETFKRGNIFLTLSLTAARGGISLSLNEEVAESLTAILETLSRRFDADKPRLDGLLRVPGLIESVDRDETKEAVLEREKALLKGLEKALVDLAAMRAQEGAHLGKVTTGFLDQIDRLHGQAEECAALQPQAMKERFQSQLDELLNATPPVTEERLAQEFALLVSKADTREELDRLAAHILAVRALLEGGGAVGRKLDFLCQELNREANTICSKSADMDLTQTGLDLKASVEQLREQIQNIE